MDLQGENRILVKLGLEMLNRTTNIGMKALILQNKLTMGAIKSHDIGFRIGPCLNASGRLDTARLSLKAAVVRIRNGGGGSGRRNRGIE
ncbi:MAG: hypothetical protein ACLTDV_04500 [Eubacterium sp.]